MKKINDKRVVDYEMRNPKNESEYRQGTEAERRFDTVMGEIGYLSIPSTEFENKFKHFDRRVCYADKFFKVDVKGLKRRKRGEPEFCHDSVWIEVINGGPREKPHSYPGWLYGEADYFAFERNLFDFYFFEKNVLQKFIKERKLNHPPVLMPESPSDVRLYTVYERVEMGMGRKDGIVLVPYRDLERLIYMRQSKKGIQ